MIEKQSDNVENLEDNVSEEININDESSETYLGFVSWYLFLNLPIFPLIVTSLPKGNIFLI